VIGTESRQAASTVNRVLAILAVALSACAAGCYSHDAAVSRLREDDPRVQTATIAEVVRAGDKAAIGELIDLLGTRDEGVRFMAAAGLHQLTGRKCRDHFANDEERKATVAQWRQWWETEGRAACGVKAPESVPGKSVTPKEHG
jgi:HEAT repeat protein